MTWWVRVLVGIGALALVGVLGFNLLKKQIAAVVFNSFVLERVGTDPSAELPDGLHVYMCGTGSPLPDPSRAGPCIGVLAGERAYVFDVGSGGVRNLGLMGFPTAKLEAVFLTHLHSDHFDGLGEMLLNAWIAGSRADPLSVYGPPGIVSVVDGFNAAYEVDGGFRTAHHGREVANPEGRGGAAIEISMPTDQTGSSIVFADQDLKVTAIRVSHEPVDPAYGYRIDYKGRSVSISGDTVYSETFAAASSGVDIMFHEALDPELVRKIGDAMLARGALVAAKIFSDIPDYHATPEDAAKAAAEAEARALVYYHTIPPMPVSFLEPLFLEGVDKEYDGSVTIGQDGFLYSLPAGSDRIIFDGLL
ncbi:MAG: MBL fold metallo-hydrolase [Pseudomonadota bacterium]